MYVFRFGSFRNRLDCFLFNFLGAKLCYEHGGLLGFPFPIPANTKLNTMVRELHYNYSTCQSVSLVYG